MDLSNPANRLTGLHTEGRSDTKKSQEKSEGPEALRNCVVLLVCGCKDHKNKDNCSQKSCEEARNIGHVIKLRERVMNCWDHFILLLTA